MARKIYSYPGIVAGEIIIKSGSGTKIRVPFANGHLDRKMRRPATFSTSDPVTQAIIENSYMFNHRIFIERVFEDENDKKEQPGAVKSDEVTDDDVVYELPEATEYPEVTTFAEAVAVLKSLPGVKATGLRSLAAAKRTAEANAIIFPNYNFE